MNNEWMIVRGLAEWLVGAWLVTMVCAVLAIIFVSPFVVIGIILYALGRWTGLW